jgi:NAD(P)-dependent dehydrogenase (short-subunit alcohol dehydrogenase family)
VPAAIRDIAALRSVADHVEREYGKIDVVVADAAMHNAGTQCPCLPVRATAGQAPGSPGSAAHLQ